MMDMNEFLQCHTFRVINFMKGEGIIMNKYCSQKLLLMRTVQTAIGCLKLLKYNHQQKLC